MEERTLNPVPETINLNHSHIHNQNQNQGIVKYLRDAPPSHYSIKIQNFSSLVDVLDVDEHYTSESFDASGYKWRLIVYPHGNAQRGGEEHLSLYLAIDETESLPLGWEVYVTFKAFVFDHYKDKYLTIQDDLTNQIRRFHKAKKEWGFHKLISLETFTNPSNGYLVDDSSVFGVEVFEVKYNGKSEHLKMVMAPECVPYTWKISKFSELDHEKVIMSEEFTGGGYKWCLRMYPEGVDRVGKRSLSLFLQLVNCPSRTMKVLAGYSLVLKSHISNNHKKIEGVNWFRISKNGFGSVEFISLNELKDESNGYLLNDLMIVEAEVKIISKVRDFI